MSYDQKAQKKVEIAYQKYVAGTGPSTINTRFSGNKYKYRIDFIAMTQTNLSSKMTRDVLREVRNSIIVDGIYNPRKRQAQSDESLNNTQMNEFCSMTQDVNQLQTLTLSGTGYSYKDYYKYCVFAVVMGLFIRFAYLMHVSP